MFKPPKMFHLRSNSENVPPPPAQPVPDPVNTLPPEPEEQRVWSPTPTETPTQDTMPEPTVIQEEETVEFTAKPQETPAEMVGTPQPVQEEQKATVMEEISQEKTELTTEDFSRYARPKAIQENEEQNKTVYPTDKTTAIEEDSNEELLNNSLLFKNTSLSVLPLNSPFNT